MAPVFPTTCEVYTSARATTDLSLAAPAAVILFALLSGGPNTANYIQAVLAPIGDTLAL
jgi:hypothetical protein